MTVLRRGVALILAALVAACASSSTPAPVSTAPPAPRAPAAPPTRTLDETVNALRPAFRGCYEEGFRKNASLQGSTTVQTTIRADGSVSDALVSASTPGFDEVSVCIARILAGARFSPPRHGGTMINVPVAFRLAGH